MDTFFFISGFLVALSLLKRLSPTERDKPSYDTFSEARNNRNKREESKKPEGAVARGRARIPPPMQNPSRSMMPPISLLIIFYTLCFMV